MSITADPPLAAPAGWRLYHRVGRALRGRPVLSLALAAIVLRLVIFMGRGAYVAFDEGWYLLLGHNLMAGDGYRLSGLVHTTLSPLFPILSGAAAWILNDTVVAGRVIAAVTSGLLVWPCWSIFDRLAGPRVALLGSALVAAMPALAPFAAPYWIGWDLWVGAEPLLHLFLYSALALTLRARDHQSAPAWALAGGMFALAYLSRPEAVLPFAMLAVGFGATVVLRRRGAHPAHLAVFGLAFVLLASPYWVYLRDALGHWALTGRVVELPAVRSERGTASGGAASGIEGMLWDNNEASYVSVLYGLDPTTHRLSSTYWGVPDRGGAGGSVDAPRTVAAAPADPRPATDARTAASRSAGRWALYGRALATIVPWYLWPFIALGLLSRRRRWRAEALVAVPLLLTSLAIAHIIAADPRTQVFLLPLLAFYAALGVCGLGRLADRRLGGATLRRGFVAGATAVVLVCLLLATSARWVAMGLTLGSPHHLVGAANHAMGKALQRIVPLDQAVMSWHPALALYAGRDWRVLPQASLYDVVRYANAIGCEYIVISAYYPGPEVVQDMSSEHLVLHVPPGTAAAHAWQLQLSGGDGPYIMGRLQPAAAPQSAGEAPQ